MLVKIHMSTPNLHCTIYDSHMSMMKKLPSDTIQLFMQTYKCEQLVIHICKCNVTNRQLIIWCFHNSICNRHHVWIWSQKISICFDTNVNTFTKLHKQQIHLSLSKIWTNMTYISFLKKQSIVTNRVKQRGAQVQIKSKKPSFGRKN